MNEGGIGDDTEKAVWFTNDALVAAEERTKKEFNAFQRDVVRL